MLSPGEVSIVTGARRREVESVWQQSRGQA